VDGTARMAGDAILETTHLGAPVTGNVMGPALAAFADGRFVIAAMRGLDDASAFQSFGQWVDEDGDAIGAAFDAWFEPTAEQDYPTAAPLPAGGLYLAWERTDASGLTTVVHALYTDDSTLPDPAPPVELVGSLEGMSPSAAAHPTLGRPFVAFVTEDGIVIADGSDLSGEATHTLLDVPLGLNHSPSVATSPDGGAVAWYLNLSGFRNEVWAQRFGWTGTGFTLGDVTRVAEGPAPPYPVGITHLEGNLYFLVWCEGASPDFRIWGQIVSLD
jgi:hypothetical protein